MARQDHSSDEQPTPTRGSRLRGDPTPPRKPRQKKSDLALERVEAQLISAGVASFIGARYGEKPAQPNKTETDNLAKIIQTIGSKPPLSYVQNLLRRVLPVGGATGTGDSFLSLFFAYIRAWYNRNPVLFKRIYVADTSIPNVPLYPKDKARKEVVNDVAEQVVTDEPIAHDGPITEATAEAGR